jgi:glycosyltransferase involved in cell wall biosynthesis
LAKTNIKILGELSFEELKKQMQNAKALVYAAEEDFGIIPVEAQACGTPVIAYGKGGCMETVVENITGIFFSNQSSNDIIQCVNKFEKLSFNSEEIRINAERFSKERFEYEFRSFVEGKLNEKRLEKKIL